MCRGVALLCLAHTQGMLLLLPVPPRCACWTDATCWALLQSKGLSGLGCKAAAASVGGGMAAAPVIVECVQQAPWNAMHAL